MSNNSMLWVLACRLFGQREPILTVALSSNEQALLDSLSGMGLAKQHKTDNHYALCPYCQLHRGRVVRSGSDWYCQCEECGSALLDPSTLGAWQIETDKLIRQLRLALGIPAQQAVANIADGIWRIGNHQKQPVILARSVGDVLHHPAEMKRAARKAYVITPKPIHKREIVLSDNLTWLPMDECFHIYGGQIQFVEPGTLADEEIDESIAASHGPFSSDFKWAHLDSWPHGAIELSKAQSAIFKVLWNFKGQSQSAERILNKAGCKSDKPADIFKVKSQNKGNLKYEGQHHAYNELVDVDSREGNYTLRYVIGS